jgi:predicted nucleic acid-binding protein
MKPMNDNVFVDSNIFLYAFTQVDGQNNKEEILKHIISSKIVLKNINISTQVINEVSSNMIRKLKFSNNEVRDFISSCYNRYNVINFSEKLFIEASEVREKYNISYYDSLIISAGLQANVNILYSEDMQHNLVVNESLTIINPFIYKSTDNL